MPSHVFRIGIGPPALNSGEVSAKAGAADDAPGSGSEAPLDEEGGTETADGLAAPTPADRSGDEDSGAPDDPWQLATSAAAASQAVTRIRVDEVMFVPVDPSQASRRSGADDRETTETYRRVVRCLSA